jgi:hypothetical protein
MTASTPLGFLLGIDWQDGGRLSSPDVGKFCGNLLPVTIGNMIDHVDCSESDVSRDQNRARLLV